MNARIFITIRKEAHHITTLFHIAFAYLLHLVILCIFACFLASDVPFPLEK